MRFRVDNCDACVECYRSAAHQRAHVCGSGGDRCDAAERELTSVCVIDPWLGVSTAAGDDERRLGETVHGIERLPPKAGCLKPLMERREGFPAHGLCPIVRDTPAREIELGELEVGDLSDAEIVREVG